MDDGWWWSRYEWQNRGGIHAHGLARCGGKAPNIYQLIKDIIDGKKAEDELKQKLVEQASSSQIPPQQVEIHLQPLIDKSHESKVTNIIRIEFNTYMCIN